MTQSNHCASKATRVRRIGCSKAVQHSYPRIVMRQTEPNQWQVILTEEERELIDELLEI